MTGFESKRQAAQGKLDNDADTLLIVYQRGFSDGKQAAQRKPLTDEEIEKLYKRSAGYGGDDFYSFARAIEAAHNIKEQP